MARNKTVAWFLTAVFAMGLTGAAIAQSPAAEAPEAPVAASPAAEAAPAPASVDVNVQKTDTAAPVAPAAETKADVNINRTESVETAPAAPASSSSSTTVWGFDGKTVLIGGALLLGIILIAVAAAGRDSGHTTVVR